jgi:hypothetical protein
MSFLDRARQAAEQARQAASERAHQAQVKIHEQAPIIQAQTREGLGIAGQNIKVGAKQAKKGAASIVDRIDPGILADIVIKATALQEKANASLRAKGSPYRIGEITITAALPPQLGFTISRIGDIDEELTGREIESAELASSLATEDFSLVPTDVDGQPVEIEQALADATDPTPSLADPAPAGVEAIGAGQAVVGWTTPMPAGEAAQVGAEGQTWAEGQPPVAEQPSAGSQTVQEVATEERPANADVPGGTQHGSGPAS